MISDNIVLFRRFQFKEDAQDHVSVILGISLVGTIVGLVAFYLYQGRFFNQLSWYLN